MKTKTMGKKRVLATALSLVFLFSMLFVPAVNAAAPDTEFSAPVAVSSADYQISDPTFPAPAVSCAKDTAGTFSATITWQSIDAADRYKVTVFKPDGAVFASRDTAGTDVTVDGLPANASFEEPYTVQVVACKGDAELCASIIKQFVPYDASSYEIGKDLTGPSDDIEDGGRPEFAGTNSPDGASDGFTITKDASITYTIITVHNIPVAADAEYLFFWLGSEIENDTFLTIDVNILQLKTEDGSVTSATYGDGETGSYNAHFISTETGEAHTHTRAGHEYNLWYDNVCYAGQSTKEYVAFPLSIFKNGDEFKGKTCTLQIGFQNLRVYNCSNPGAGNQISEMGDRPIYVDSFGSIRDIDAFESNINAMLANYRLDDITYTTDLLPYADSDRRFAAPEVEVALSETGTETTFSWQPFADADEYEVTVYNSLMNVAASVTTDDCTASVAGLVEGLAYTAQVTAKKDDDTLASSACKGFMNYDNSKYYYVGNDGSGLADWASGGPTAETPDGQGIRITNPTANWISYDFENIYIPEDAKALVIWIGQEQVTDGSYLIGAYKLRFKVNDNFDNLTASGQSTPIYYISPDGTVTTHDRGSDRALNTWWWPDEKGHTFAGTGYVIIPLDLYDSNAVNGVLGTTTSIRFEYSSTRKYSSANESQGEVGTLDRYIYMDNVGTISNIDAFLADYAAFSATYNPTETFYYGEDFEPVVSADDVTFTVNAAEDDDTVAVPLYLESGKAIDSAAFTLDYDADALELTSITGADGEEISAAGDSFVVTNLQAGVSCFAVAHFQVTASELATNSTIGLTCTDGAVDTRDIAVIKSAQKGDINNDAVVNILDLIRIKKYEAAERDNTGFEEIDVNSDGAWDTNDIVALRKQLLGVS